VGSAATGSGSGADWSNQKAWSGTPTRGDTWYLADGTYATKTFSVAVSGTTLITIKKATVADHGGISTGWVDTMGDGQATFSGHVIFNTSYWVFDGASHGSTLWSTTSSDYGFFFNGLNGAVEVFNLSTAMSDVTVTNVAGVAIATDVEKFFVQTDNSTKAVSNITISRCLIDGWQNAYYATSAGLTMDNWVFEYNVCVNGFGSATNHGEWCNNNFGLMTNQVIRYNRFVGPTGGYTGVIVANNNDIQDPVIYGNVFDGYDSGNGVITGTSGGTIIRALIYNNTFLNCGVGWLGSNAHTSPVAKNNLLYNMSAAGQTGVTVDYSHYVSCTSVPSGDEQDDGERQPFHQLGRR
jgi:hypothetical protein